MTRPSYSVDTQNRIADVQLGLRVDRATAVIAASQTLFTVSGGSVLLTGFYGEITVAIDAGNQLTLNYDADVSANGEAYADTVLGSQSADINTYVAGRMLYLPAEAGALTITAAGGACPIDIAPLQILPAGHFDLTSTGTTTTGKIRWSLWYIPLDEGAKVVAN